MLVYVKALKSISAEASNFLALDVDKGWLKISNDAFGKVLVDGLDAMDPRSSIYASQEDIILEAEDLVDIKYDFSSMDDVRSFTDKVLERMEVPC